VKRKLGQKPQQCKAAIFWEDTVFPDEEFLKSFPIDTRAVYLEPPAYKMSSNLDGSEEYTDELGIVRRRPSDGYFFDIVSNPLGGSLTSQLIKNYPWPRIDPAALKGQAEAAGRKARDLHERTEYAVMASCTLAPLTFTQMMRGFENWSIDLLTEPALLEELMDMYIDFQMGINLEFYRAAGKYCDVAYCLGDDLGTQNSFWIQPALYRKYIKPRHKKIIEEVKRYTDAKILFHSCGAVAELIPDFVDCGIDALTPVQVSATGMEPMKLKREYGNVMAFWGGIDTQKILPFGSQNDVKTEVLKLLDQFYSDRSGYVLNSVHNILPEVPPENFLAIFEAVREWTRENSHK
jgi:uroporphyrinogen decarboxylase